MAHYIAAGRGAPALRAKWAALRELRSVLADRARVQSTRTASAADLAPFLEPNWLAAKRREKAFISSRRV